MGQTTIQGITAQATLDLFKGIYNERMTLLTATTPVLIGGKANPMQGRVKKVSRSTMRCGSAHSYSAKIDKESKAIATSIEVAKTEADDQFHKVDLVPFKAEELWKGKGKHLGGAVATHTESGAMYLLYFLDASVSPEVHYELDGQVIDKDKIQGLNEKSRTGAVNEIDGTETELKKVMVTTLKIESLKGFIRENGEEFFVIDNL